MPLKNNVLFVQMARSAGTSISIAMGLGRVNAYNLLKGGREKCHTWNLRKIHHYAFEYDKLFAVLRNPVDRMNSLWFFEQEKIKNYAKQKNTSPQNFFMDCCQKFRETDSWGNQFSTFRYMLEEMPESHRLLNFKYISSEWRKLVNDWQVPWDPTLRVYKKKVSRGALKLSYTNKQDLHELYKDDYAFAEEHGISLN